MIKTYFWARFSSKLKKSLRSLKHSGALTATPGVKLINGSSKCYMRGSSLAIYWLVNEESLEITNASHITLGGPALMAAAEALCSLSIGKKVAQAITLSADDLDAHFRSRSDKMAFPEESSTDLNVVIDTLDALRDKCGEEFSALSSTLNRAAPMEKDSAKEYPGWGALTKEEKIAVIEEALDKEVRPYVSMDGGGVEIIELEEGDRLIIAYQGACAFCFAATGATLSYIQQTLNKNVSSSIVVVPKF